MDAAFCRAERVTFAASMILAASMSTYSPDSFRQEVPVGTRQLHTGRRVARRIGMSERSRRSRTHAVGRFFVMLPPFRVPGAGPNAAARSDSRGRR
ncbi:hypothetical protein BIV25_19845 [Streptomyces sp. MUSC 14]|nr:hypothetical protein BIV25_19845 [Streptomyces sp. MUSC 14]